MKICPNPQAWNKIYEQLTAYSNINTCIPSSPPIPLILAAWNYSNDIEKKLRWKETITWATENDCKDLVDSIQYDQFYFVDKPTDYMVGPMGGPTYNTWDYEPKKCPSLREIDRNLKILVNKWSEIVGDDLAKITYPIKFTGDKARRLVVGADGTSNPPWGSWTKLSYCDSKKRTFTKFRASINQAISPQEIDHIDFITDEAQIDSIFEC